MREMLKSQIRNKAKSKLNKSNLSESLSKKPELTKSSSEHFSFFRKTDNIVNDTNNSI